MPLKCVATLVLLLNLTNFSAVQAATTQPSPDYEEAKPNETSAPVTTDRSKTELTDIAPAPPPSTTPSEISSEYFYRYRKSMSARLGLAYDTEYYKDKKQPLYQLGFLVLFHTPSLLALEAGADLNSDGNGALHLARRWIYSNTRFRPYTKAGAGIRIVAKDALATFVDHENYQIRAAAGFEQLIMPPMSLRVELELMASIHSQAALFTLGYSWAW